MRRTNLWKKTLAAGLALALVFSNFAGVAPVGSTVMAAAQSAVTDYTYKTVALAADTDTLESVSYDGTAKTIVMNAAGGLQVSTTATTSFTNAGTGVNITKWEYKKGGTTIEGSSTAGPVDQGDWDVYVTETNDADNATALALPVKVGVLKITAPTLQESDLNPTTGTVRNARTFPWVYDATNRTRDNGESVEANVDVIPTLAGTKTFNGTNQTATVKFMVGHQEADRITEPGTYDIRVYFTGTNYSGTTADGKTYVTIPNAVSFSKKVSINDSSVKATLDYYDTTFDGTAKAPTPTVRLGDRTLAPNTDYTVRYENNINVGKGSVIITPVATSDYLAEGGSITINFNINRASATVGNFDFNYVTAIGTGNLNVSENANITAEEMGIRVKPADADSVGAPTFYFVRTDSVANNTITDYSTAANRGLVTTYVPSSTAPATFDVYVATAAGPNYGPVVFNDKVVYVGTPGADPTRPNTNTKLGTITVAANTKNLKDYKVSLNYDEVNYFLTNSQAYTNGGTHQNKVTTSDAIGVIGISANGDVIKQGTTGNTKPDASFLTSGTTNFLVQFEGNTADAGLVDVIISASNANDTSSAWNGTDQYFGAAKVQYEIKKAELNGVGRTAATDDIINSSFIYNEANPYRIGYDLPAYTLSGTRFQVFTNKDNGNGGIDEKNIPLTRLRTLNGEFSGVSQGTNATNYNRNEDTLVKTNWFKYDKTATDLGKLVPVDSKNFVIGETYYAIPEIKDVKNYYNYGTTEGLSRNSANNLLALKARIVHVIEFGNAADKAALDKVTVEKGVLTRDNIFIKNGAAGSKTMHRVEYGQDAAEWIAQRAVDIVRANNFQRMADEVLLDGFSASDLEITFYNLNRNKIDAPTEPGNYLFTVDVKETANYKAYKNAGVPTLDYYAMSVVARDIQISDFTWTLGENGIAITIKPGLKLNVLDTYITYYDANGKSLGSTYSSAAKTFRVTVSPGTVSTRYITGTSDPVSVSAKDIDIYHYYNKKTGDHIYVKNANLSAKAKYKGYANKGVAFKATGEGKKFYVLKNKKTGMHMINGSKTKAGFTYVTTFTTGGPGAAKAVYRVYNKKTGAYFYTTSKSSANSKKKNTATYKVTLTSINAM